MRALPASLAFAVALTVLLGVASSASAQSDPPAPIAWEVVSDSLQVDDLAVSGDSVLYLSGPDRTWVWRRSGPDRFVELNDFLRFQQVFMASTGHFFLENLVGVSRSDDYLRTASVVVQRGEAVIETHSGAIIVATDNLGVERSTDGGDSWTVIGRDEPAFRAVFGRFFAQSPPTAALPHGRLVLVGLGGAVVSTDDGLTWQASNLGQAFGYDSEHVVYSGVHDAFYTYMNGPVEDGGSTRGVVRESADGVTWTTRGRLPADNFGFVGRLAAGTDGSLWGIMVGTIDTLSYGRVYRSMDRGATWEVAGAFDGRDLVGNPLRVQDLVIDAVGRVWVGFRQGVISTRVNGAVLRTVEPVAASGEASAPPKNVGLLRGVWPNPAWGTVQVAVTVSEPQVVRVRVVDVLGREVAVVHAELLRGAQALTVETAGWPAGTYVVEATAGVVRQTQAFTVTR
ncbi:MAG: T9SS type A sorting domain-containing protein [Bacteroidota bacterium]